MGLSRARLDVTHDPPLVNWPQTRMQESEGWTVQGKQKVAFDAYQ